MPPRPRPAPADRANGIECEITCAPSSVSVEILGSRPLHFARPWRASRHRPVSRVSSLYDSAPRDLVDQPRFLNAALEVETDLSPLDLLAEPKRLELALGRDPETRRWGPRVIDLDILCFDGKCITDPEHGLIVRIRASTSAASRWSRLRSWIRACFRGATAPTCASRSRSSTCSRLSPTRRFSASAGPIGPSRGHREGSADGWAGIPPAPVAVTYRFSVNSYLAAR